MARANRKSSRSLSHLALSLGGHGDVGEDEGGGDGEHWGPLRLVIGHCCPRGRELTLSQHIREKKLKVNCI